MTQTTAAKNWSMAPMPDVPPRDVVFGSSVEMMILAERIDRIAQVNVPVLLYGENGTGKEIIARIIHHQGLYADGAFIRLTCPGLTRPSMETAFAVGPAGSEGDTNRQPRTIYLDEVAELEPDLQAVLINLLGGQPRGPVRYPAPAALRLICGTAHDLRKEVESRTFRSDLLYRIDAVRLRVPSLHERAEDLPTIANYLLDLHSAKLNLPTRRFSPDMLDRLSRYRFPGNIRELENLVMRYIVLGDEEEVYASLKDSAVFEFTLDLSSHANRPLKHIVHHAVEQLEGSIIRATLAQHKWNRRRTAKQLEISYRSLLYKIQAYGIPHLRSTRPAAGN